MILIETLKTNIVEDTPEDRTKISMVGKTYFSKVDIQTCPLFTFVFMTRLIFC